MPKNTINSQARPLPTGRLAPAPLATSTREAAARRHSSAAATAGSAHRASSACHPSDCASGEADAAAMAAPPMMPVV